MRPERPAGDRPGRSAGDRRGRSACSRRGRLAAALLAGALLIPPALAADLTPQQQIETRMMCYCGCADLTVRVCTCGTADAIRAEIATRLAAGETPDQVVAVFVARHGEKILSAPTKSGFNLLAWTMPFAAILVAGGLVVALVRRWERAGSAARSGPDADAPPSGLSPEADGALRDRVRRDIETRL